MVLFWGPSLFPVIGVHHLAVDVIKWVWLETSFMCAPSPTLLVYYLKYWLDSLSYFVLVNKWCS